MSLAQQAQINALVAELTVLTQRVAILEELIKHPQISVPPSAEIAHSVRKVLRG